MCVCVCECECVYVCIHVCKNIKMYVIILLIVKTNADYLHSNEFTMVSSSTFIKLVKCLNVLIATKMSLCYSQFI